MPPLIGIRFNESRIFICRLKSEHHCSGKNSKHMHVLWRRGFRYLKVETRLLFTPHIKISGYAPGTRSTWAHLCAGRKCSRCTQCVATTQFQQESSVIINVTITMSANQTGIVPNVCNRSVPKRPWISQWGYINSYKIGKFKLLTSMRRYINKLWNSEKCCFFCYTCCIVAFATRFQT